jgi:hypothetical protein
MKNRVILLLALAAAGLAAPLFAQSSYGRMTGRITDPQGAVTAGAQITLTQIETNISISGASNSEGLYDFPNLLPGTYRMEVKLDGFKTHTRSGVSVRVGDILAIDVQMEVGAITESISVTAEAPLLDTASASSGQVVTNQQLTELPLSGRGVSFLMTLSPGVISTNAPMHGWLPQARGSVSDLSVAGTRTRSSEFTLDGIPNMERAGTIAFQPPPEMIQEFRVQTAAYDASLGRFTGANINMVLKSGANQLHGSMWFSHLSRPLMTHPFFVNRNLYDTASGPPTEEKRNRLWPATKTNRYRVQVGGPVVIPKLYDGRNKTFFSYGNDFMLRQFANVSTQTVPTAAQRLGNFSDLLRLGATYQIYDPNTITPAPNGRFSRQPFPGNVVPASRIDSVAKNLLNYYPLPNATGTADGRNNFFATAQSRIDYWAHMGRFDQVINDKHRFYVSLSAMRTDGDQGRNFVNDALGNITVNRYTGAGFDHVWTVRPDMVANFRYGLTRMANTGAPPTLGLDLAGLGFNSSFTKLVDRELASLPAIQPSIYSNIGTNLPSKSAFTSHYFNGSVSKSAGSHTMRVGGEYRALLDNSFNYGNVSGSFDFGTLWTRGPLDNSPGAPIGQDMAALLLGLPTAGFMDNNASLAERSGYLGVYFHDDWKATRKLTINFGIRYEVEQPTTERYNRANRGFDFSAVNPANTQARINYARNPLPELPASQFQLNGGLLFAGVNGQPRTLWNTDRNNFAPRVGLAYQLRPGTVIRAGYAIFYNPMGTDRSDVDQQGFNQRTRLNPSNDNGQTFVATLANPYPTGLLPPPGSSGGLATYLGLGPSFFNPNLVNPYMQRWTFNIQRQLSSNWLVEIGYTGNRGTRLDMQRDFSALPQQYLSRSPERDNPTVAFLSQNHPNPFRGINEFSNSPAYFGNANLSRAQILEPFPHFTGVVTRTNEGFSWYHAGHIRLEKRFQKDFSVSGHYTWSKFMEAVELLNAADTHPHHVISPQDRPQHLALSALWDIPFGKGRQYMASAPKVVDYALGGWSLNVIYQWQSGPPMQFGNALYRGTLQDLVIPYADRAVERWFNTDQFERRANMQLEANVRTLPLRMTGLRSDGWNTWDVALYKEFRFTERWRLQLRAEAVDALNHAMFNPPVNGPVNTAFGSVLATIWTEQRKITVAAKLSF